MRFSLLPLSSPPALSIRRFPSFPTMSWRGGGGERRRGRGGRTGHPWCRTFCYRPTSSSHQDQDQSGCDRVPPPPSGPRSGSGFHRPPTHQSHRPPPFDGTGPPPPPPPHQQRGYRIPQVPPPRGASRPVHGYIRPKPADYRHWVSSKSQLPHHFERFRLLSYNILADYLAKEHRSKLYFHIPPSILDWEWRKRKILLEIGLWSPDIMCLQEVDKFQDLEKEMAIRGYCGIWKMRTGTATDGCATFWRTNRFQLQHEEFIEFNKLGLRDNIAQICVLESQAQGNVEPGSLSSVSPVQSEEPNKVVVCNIHVLYNPRRGEIKLGQVRVLLDRAYSVSKLWNDAPLVICGDFNSVPKSPLYNFLSGQKLDLSGLARDQVSGQYTACSRAQQPYPNYAQNRARAQSSDSYKRSVLQDNGFAGIPDEKDEPFHGPMASLNLVDKSSYSCQRGKDSNELSKILGREICHEVECLDLPGEMKEGKADSCNSMPSLQVSREKDSPLTIQEVHINSEVHNPQVDIIAQNSSMDVLSEISPNENKFLSPKSMDSSCKFHMDSSNCGKPAMEQEFDVSFSESVSSNIDDKNFDFENSESNAMMQSNVPDDNSPCNNSHISNKSCSEETSRSKSKNHSVEIQFDQPEATFSNFKTFNPNIKVESDDHGSNTFNDSIQKDSDPTFLAELYGVDVTEITEGSGIFDSSISYQTFDQCNTEFQYKHTHDPSAWTPADLETASGKSECTFLQHNLKLKSVYTRVEDCAGTRDSSGEPEITSYNRDFMGTVDYIWCSEGVQTVKVLDTIRKDVLRRTPGFPTAKWGSDHIALACELAFEK